MKKKLNAGGISSRRASWYKRLLIMKLTLVLCLFAGLLSSMAETNAQSTRLSLKIQQGTVKDVIEEVERQTDYSFMYDNQVFDVNRSISVELENSSIREILDQLIEGQNLKYELVNRFIVVSQTKQEREQQSRVVIKGKVTSDSGEALPGVTIVVKGTSNGTITDGDGNFSLSNVASDATLVFSFIGMQAQEVAIAGQREISVVMHEESIGLDEVVAIGYGTVKKSDLTGSVGVVKSNQLDQQTNSNLGTAIQGKIAGVSVESSGGAPGAGMNLQIRGAGSLNNNNPLILVDDIAVTSMNNINPNDIEAIQVLKDASAAAIYGSRAANGVVLITTKSGKKGAVKINASVDVGMQEVAKTLDLATTDEWIKIITEAATAAGNSVPEVALNPEEPGRGVDWQDEVYRNAMVQNYSVGASGGSDNLKYNFSLGYLDQDGIVDNTDYSRLNLRLKSEFQKGRVKVGESILLTQETVHDMPGVSGQGGNVVGATVMMVPGFSIYNEDAVGGYGGASGAVLDVFNPVAALNLKKSKSDYYKALINLYGEVEILDGLKYKLSTGVTLNEHKNDSREAAYQVGTFFSNTQNYAYRSSAMTKYWQIENTLSYARDFGKHSLNAVVGYTTYKNKYDSFSASKKGMADGIWVLNAGSDSPTAAGTASANTMISYLGRVIYSYDNRYIFTGTFRRDGSSRFSDTKRWGNFPSVSAAWNMANEKFFENMNRTVSQLKLRASYGKLGNQEIGDYQYVGAITSGVSYAVGEPNTLWVGNIQTEYVPKNLKWETTSTSNVGVDVGLWNGKVNYSLDVFQKKTTDLLLRVPIPLSAGADENPYSNAGEIKNKGLEMMLNYNGKIKDFKFSITGTLSHVKNEVKELSTGSQVLTGSSATHGGSAVTYTKVGYPVYSFFLIKTDGLFRSEDEILAHSKDGALIQPNAQVGDIRFVDANEDGKIDGNDRVYCGSPFPKYEYGLRLEGAWKFLDASIYLQGTHGNKIYNGIRTYTESAIYTCEYSTDLLDSYSFNKSSDIPRIDLNDPNGNGVDNSDRFLEDGSYLRVKTVQIGFTLPKKWTDRISVENCRFYVGANNLITWTDYKGYNPDIGNSSISSRGIDFRQYPLNRSYHIGFQMNF
jgi:TonB-linked SusC/RagA family outer membrane protein